MINLFKKIITGKSKKNIDGSQINYGDNKNKEHDGAADSGYEDWLNDNYEEGQLSIDVYQTSKELVIKSTIAGVKSDNIDISINNDMLTIRGKREMAETIEDEDYLYKECYWGAFSRSIILPVEIKLERIAAYLEDGVLTINLTKAKNTKQVSIKIKEK